MLDAMICAGIAVYFPSTTAQRGLLCRTSGGRSRRLHPSCMRSGWASCSRGPPPCSAPRAGTRPMRIQRSSSPSRWAYCHDTRESGRQVTCTLDVSFPCLHDLRTEHPTLWDPSCPCDVGCYVPCQPAEGCQHHCTPGASIVRLH